MLRAMRRRSPQLILFFGTLLLFLGNVRVRAEEPLRQWRSIDGSSVLGQLIAVGEDKVTLEVKGKRYVLDVARLSGEDRNYMDAWVEKNPGKFTMKEIGPWPTKYDGTGEVTVETLREEPGAYVYQTEHYLFAFDTKVPKRNLDQIAAVFEAVSGALASMPIERLRPSFARLRCFPVVFFSNQQQYEKAGGQPGSVGIYDVRRQEILIRLDVLLANENRGSNLPQRERYQVLVHELTHQAMYPAMIRMPTWYAEGVAEYMSAAHFATARFDFRNMNQHIRSHMKRFVREDADGGFTLPSVAGVFGMTNQQWNDDNAKAGESASKKYATGLLLTHWFHHQHGGGKGAEIAAFLDQLAARKSLKEAAKGTLFAAGGGLDEIEKVLVKYWDAQGLKLRFTEQ